MELNMVNVTEIWSSAIGESESGKRTGLKARTATGIVALVLGFTMLYVVGFSHSTPLHNAAHDTRHAISFPCH